MKKIVILIYLVFSVANISAQGIIQKVNDIKKSDDYIYAQYAYPSSDSALVRATEWLALSAERVSGQSVTGVELQPYVKHIFLKGKSVTRAFVYMKKSDVKDAMAEISKNKKPISSFMADTLTIAIMSKKDIFAVRDYFESCVKAGTIIQYGSPKDVNNINNKYIAFFNYESLAPTSVLSPVDDEDKRQNLMNGEHDSIDNHHNCYAIWYLPE